MKKLALIIILTMVTSLANAVYLAYEFAPRKGRVVQVHPPIPNKPGVIYPISTDVIGVPTRYLVVETDENNKKTIRQATSEEKQLIDAPSWAKCHDENSPVWFKWADSIQTNLNEVIQTIDSNFWNNVVVPYRGIMQINGYNPLDTNITYEFVASDMITRGQNSTNTEEIAKITRDGITLNVLYNQIKENGYERAWDIPSTQIYTNLVESYQAICE